MLIPTPTTLEQSSRTRTCVDHTPQMHFVSIQSPVLSKFDGNMVRPSRPEAYPASHANSSPVSVVLEDNDIQALHIG